MRGRDISRWDHVFLICVLLMTLLGLVMIYSASSVASVYEFGEGTYWLKRQILWVFVGLVAMGITMNIPQGYLKKLALPLLGFSLVLLVLVAIPGIGTEVNGARRWFRIGKFNFQPSELAALSLLFFFAGSLSRKIQDKTETLWETLKQWVLLGTVCFLILKQPNYSMVFLISVVYFTLLLASGISKRFLFLLGLLGILFAGYFIAIKPYRMKRILSWLDLEKHRFQGGYHIIQSLTGIGSGGLTGLGFGNSRQKFLYLPERHTDFIFAIIAEELGFIGTSLVLLLLMFFIHRGFLISIHQEDPFFVFLGIGIMAFMGIQILINIGVVLNLFPTTGLPLPFISYGGTAYLMRAIAAGLILNISRTFKNQEEPQGENLYNPSRRGNFPMVPEQPLG